MARAIAAFLLLFSFLSLVVHLNGMSELFGVAALTVFAIDLVCANFGRRPRPVRAVRDPLLLGDVSAQLFVYRERFMDRNERPR